MERTATDAEQRALINHIALYVVNLQTSTQFYKEVIGLEMIPEPFHDGKHTWFSIGGKAALHIIAGAPGVEVHRKDSHLCFSVTSVSKFIEQLNQNSIAYESATGEKSAVTTRPDGVEQIYFTDPDGFWIEINNAK
ncbi:MAG: VOC family protein [Ginsengibacter sp.]